MVFRLAGAAVFASQFLANFNHSSRSASRIDAAVFLRADTASVSLLMIVDEEHFMNDWDRVIEGELEQLIGY